MFLKIFICFLLFLKIETSRSDDIIFNGFHGANLTLDGSAEIKPNGILMLNNETRHQTSHAFSPNPFRSKESTFGNSISFSTTFVFAIVPEYPTMGGSGFTFVLSSSKDFSMAFPNQFFGLFNSSNNGNSSNHVLAVEFDTIINPDVGDTNANHVGIDINGVRSTQSAAARYISNSGGGFQNLSLISGESMQAWIDYDAKGMQLNVTLAPLNVPKPVIPLLSETMNLSDIILDPIYVGFSSSTTALYSYHYILGWSFKIDGQAQALDISSLPAVPRILKKSKLKHRVLTISLPFAIVMLVLVIVAGARYVFIRRDKFSELLEDWELDFGTHRFSYKELYRATKGFNDKNLLGVGGFGRVYKGTLRSTNLEVAVKKVSHDSKQGIRQFVAEIASIGKLRHRNLVQLLGYSRRRGELFLVYEYMPNGSLDKFIFEGDNTLGWDRRFRIVKGVAFALLYLHEDWEQVVLHRDVKASNVLLDNDMNAQLGDFGLARLYNHGADPKTTHIVGTMGYIAPELTKYGKATTKSDVFAFGVFLLEVACGRRPIEATKLSNEQNLVDWVFGLWRKGMLIQTRDPRLGDKYVAEELDLVLKLGLFCTHPVLSARPTMRQVVQFLDGSSLLPDLLINHVSLKHEEQKQGTGFCDYIMSYPSFASSTPASSSNC